MPYQQYVYPTSDDNLIGTPGLNIVVQDYTSIQTEINSDMSIVAARFCHSLNNINPYGHFYPLYPQGGN